MRIDMLKNALEQHCSGLYQSIFSDRGEITLEVECQNYKPLVQKLRDETSLFFEELIDLCGVDYSEYKNEKRQEKRFAVVVHLLSITHNYRIRVRCFLLDASMPMIDSLVSIYNCANWYEREAFDMYGIVFRDHPDLRRILTDYGFVGYPMRKDFPISGSVEMIFDKKENRVRYQPVSIPPRNNVPRVVREEGYGAEDN